MSFIIMTYLLLSLGTGPWQTSQYYLAPGGAHDQYHQSGELRDKHLIDKDPRYPADPSNPFSGSKSSRKGQW